MSVKVLTIDAAFTHAGAAVIELAADQDNDKVIEVVCVETASATKKKNVRKATDDAERCKHLFTELRALADKHHVAAIIAELPSGSQSARAARCLGYAEAVVVCVVEATKLPSIWTTPDEGKLVYTASRSASKDEMIAKAAALWSRRGLVFECKKNGSIVKDKAEHIADALAAFESAKEDSLLRILRNQLQK